MNPEKRQQTVLGRGHLVYGHLVYGHLVYGQDITHFWLKPNKAHFVQEWEKCGMKQLVHKISRSLMRKQRDPLNYYMAQTVRWTVRRRQQNSFFLMSCWPYSISIYACNQTNLMHCLSSVYSVTIPLHVSGLLVANHQEVTMYICDSWYVLYGLVDWINWR
jgi:hypothetical protein